MYNYSIIMARLLLQKELRIGVSWKQNGFARQPGGTSDTIEFIFGKRLCFGQSEGIRAIFAAGGKTRMLDLTSIPVVDNHCHPILREQQLDTLQYRAYF